MCHNNSAMVAVSLTENPTVFQKTLGLNDFYFGCEEFPHPMGHIAMLGKSEATMFKGDAPPFTPHFVLDKLATHALDFWLTSEDLPDPENRVAIRPDGSIELIYTENNLEPHHRLIGKLKGLLSSIGCHENALWGGSLYLKKKMDISKTAHQCGTLVFGTDPQRSVLDTDCKAHDLDNLYVVDGGFFVSSTALNPALTIMANALRVGSHLRHRLYVPTLAGSES
jgi:hypothetical protein